MALLLRLLALLGGLRFLLRLGHHLARGAHSARQQGHAAHASDAHENHGQEKAHPPTAFLLQEGEERGQEAADQRARERQEAEEDEPERTHCAFPKAHV